MLAIILTALTTFAPITPAAIHKALDATVYIRGDFHEHDKAVMDFPPASDTLPPIIVAQIDEDKYDVPECSGFVVYARGTVETIMTAGHCAKSEHKTDRFWTGDGALENFGWVKRFFNTDVVPQKVFFADGDIGKVTNIWRSTTSDIAILTVTSMRKHPYVFMHNGIERGQNLFVLGMPQGTPFAYSAATAMQGPEYHGTMYIDKQEEYDSAQFRFLWAIDCPSCAGGDSGAGVFNASGQVIGMLDAKREEPAQMGMIVPEPDLLTNLQYASSVYTR